MAIFEEDGTLTECQKIGRALRRHFYTHDYKLHNQYIFNWESDFFCITSAKYTVECEIKISKADYKADFKKIEKHNTLAGNANNWKPNKFYYVCPEGLINLKDLPAYAGLLWFKEGVIVEVKKADYIHKEKLDLKGVLLSKYYNRTLSIMDKLLKFRNEFSYGLSDDKKRSLDRFINKFHFD